VDRFSSLIERCSRTQAHEPIGVVQDVVGMVVEVGGLRAAVGQTLEVQTEHGERLELEVVGFRSDRLLASPLGNLSGLHSGSLARLSDRGASIGVGSELLGRVFDAFGNPLDGGARPDFGQRYPIHRSPPATPHHAGALAALPTLDRPQPAFAPGAWPSHPPGDARDGGYRRIRARKTLGGAGVPRLPRRLPGLAVVRRTHARPPALHGPPHRR